MIAGLTPSPGDVSGLTIESYLPLVAFWTGVLILGVASVRLANRSGLPTLLLYLALGLALGEGGFGVQFDSFEMTQILGYTALALILAEGGLTTQWSSIRDSVGAAASLSTLGVLVSVGVVGFVAYYALDLAWPVALLIGAIVASTDAAAVFSVLRTVPLSPRVRGILEAESGFNDAPVVILVVTLADLTRATASGGVEAAPWWTLPILAAAQLLGGVLLGLIAGWAGGWLMARAASSSSGLFALGVLAVCLLTWAAGDLLNVSGFIAIYVCGLVLGNQKLPHRAAVRGFAQAIGWLAQIMLFVLLGLLVDPGELSERIIPAAIIGVTLVLLARPLSVLISVAPFGYTWREQAFLSWAGLRGAVPIVLATVPLTSGAPYTGWLVTMVFVLVVALTLLQAPTLPWVARRLGLVDDQHVVDLDVDVVPLSEIDSQVMLVTIGQESKLHGTEVFELRLPRGASVSHIVREGASFTPQPHTALRRGDRLLLVTQGTHRSAVEARLGELSQDGRLAGWVT